MKQREAAERLLRFTNINYNNEDLPASREDEAVDEFEDVVEVEDLRRLGIKALNADEYRDTVLSKEGLVSIPSAQQTENVGEKERSSNNTSVIFSSSVPGFSRSSKAGFLRFFFILQSRKFGKNFWVGNLFRNIQTGEI